MKIEVYNTLVISVNGPTPVFNNPIPLNSDSSGD